MKEIMLTKGKVALVDDGDYEWLNQWKWYYSYWGYAARAYREKGKFKHISMHRLILNTPDGLETDHRDGNRLNNQRNNLRSCTTSQNKMNQSKQSNNASGYKGIFWHSDHQKWGAKIVKKYKVYFLGYYDDPKTAALAYNQKAIELFGEFARLNTIKE